MRSHLFVALVIVSISGSAWAQIPTGNLAMWLKADAGTTVSSSALTSWADQSGNGHNATPDTNSAAITLASNEINGLPAVQFNGSSQWMDIAGQVLTSQQFTVFAVATDTGGDGIATFREIFSNWTPGNGAQSIFLGTTGNLAQTTRAARFTDDLGGANDPNTPQLGVGQVPNNTTIVLSGESTASDATAYLDGTALGDRGSALTTRDPTTAYALGSQGTGGIELWQGDIAEVIVYNSALSDADRNTVTLYLEQKYGVPEPSVLGFLAVASLLIRRRAN
ncbi:MAG TPA: hypothetical protein VKK61_09320 [Tepidisphaeraceae bacterium]|nr:hypothetical protein [Tepidisphaeraceae bacterium]